MTICSNSTGPLLSLALAAILLVGCATDKPKPNQIFLMPAPDLYGEVGLDPFSDATPLAANDHPGMLYATDRAPADFDERRFDYYSDQRGYQVRLGMASIDLGDSESITWDEVRRVALLKNRVGNYPLEVSSVDEYGVLASSIRPFDETTPDDTPGVLFAEQINSRLTASGSRDVFIYVHGYKVNFENPVLVASELWHFLGYRGAFVAYSWPATFRLLAYFSDLDDAVSSSRGLRQLVRFVSEHTDAERIHIIGYSAGTRVVGRMIADFGIYGLNYEETDIERARKLSHVMLIGSDIDQSILSGYLLDGALRVVDSLTIYQSSDDSALNLSRKVFGRERSGQVVDENRLTPKILGYLNETPSLRVIDVTNAEGGTSGSGHSYFRTSRWVSSDILATLLYDLKPDERGLKQESGIWRFPPDYIERLGDAINRVDQ